MYSLVKTFDLIALTCACCRTSQSYPCVDVFLSLILVGWGKMIKTSSMLQAFGGCTISYSRLLLELDLPNGQTKINTSYFHVPRERLSIHLPPTLVNLSAWNALQVVIIS